MGEIRVEWRRTWQTAPYESESVNLSMTDTVQTKSTTVEGRAKELALAQRKMFDEIAFIGDQIMQDRIGRT